MERSNLEHLLEMAEAGIKGHDQSGPVSVALVWDREAYERAVNGVVDKKTIDDLAAKSGVLPQNIAKLNPAELIGFLVDPESFWNAIRDSATIFNILPQDVAKLNPVQLTALVVYTLPERREREGFSHAGYLELLGYALNLYIAMPSMPEMPIPQRDAPLRFFRETFRRMIRDSGYAIASNALQDFAQESILDEKFKLDDNELLIIIRNIKNNSDINGLLQDFHTWDGLKTYLLVEDEEANKQIREIVWRSVPRLIEGQGYVRYRLGNLPLVDAELAKQGHIDGLVEEFKEISGGWDYFIVPGRQRELEDYNRSLEMQQRRAKRRAEEQQTKRQPQVSHTPDLPVTQPQSKEKAEAPNLEAKVTSGGIVKADTPNKEYEHPVYKHLSELRSNLYRLLMGDKRSRNAVLTASNRVLDYVNGLPQPIGHDVAAQLGEILKGSKTARKLGENTVWNKITGLHKDYVMAYGSMASRISYSLGKLVGRQ